MLLVAVVLWSKLRWTIPASVMVAPAPLLYGFVLAMQTVKYIIPSAVYEYVDECIWSSFQRTVLTFFSNINGTQIKFSGDFKSLLDADLNENVLIIMNHQTNVDWITTDMLTIQKNTTGRIRFMHKDELKYVPLYGVYFWVHGCINVGRYGSFKESKSVAQLQHLEKNQVPTWLVIFPEGTRYNPLNKKVIEKSEKFAEGKGLRVLNNTLTPRTRGVYLALRELHQYFDAVYDVTIAYDSTRQQTNDGTQQYQRSKAPGMVEFIQSYTPGMHMNIRRIDMSSVPHTDEEEVTRWLHALFERKDSLLDNFINEGELVSGEGEYQPVTRWRQTLPYNVAFLLVTAATLSVPAGRKLYTTLAVAGSLAGLVWMRFH